MPRTKLSTGLRLLDEDFDGLVDHDVHEFVEPLDVGVSVTRQNTKRRIAKREEVRGHREKEDANARRKGGLQGCARYVSRVIHAQLSCLLCAFQCCRTTRCIRAISGEEVAMISEGFGIW